MENKELSTEESEAIRAIDSAAQVLIGCDQDTYIREHQRDIHAILQAKKRNHQFKPFKAAEEIRGGVRRDIAIYANSWK